ncbi:leucine--tRNA ligase [Bordetella holmesii]|uniref:Leucine--tRNA ligase n=2 Tax=Bordetella holmesii TaxID=35814 RepID=A0A158M8Y1_9BORD|nr:leucine--tRNA ligase [Bordetella holmesii]EWM46013.1 leucine--tRNA ligase [Bordetella holmesii 70147]EWM48237.1 leucine--tRNA ligase [Bordetella holmesii 41130]EWM50147.1 leucine--tRNA ligase [Bordetella holmesii 35009]AMD44636.1 leucine--tRNA ligase [Bordetella holmesii H558]AMD49883.1 leucyl-tRNA synthetase [Bordetella holmesii F627]
MQERYQPTLVEAAAQEDWQARDAYLVHEHAKNADGSEKPKFYACSMLPYPSGKLHMGHVRNYTINDMMARQLRMRGYNVLMPMGWDAFGMPAENAAIKSKVPPAKWTYDNIAYMKKQMKAMGLAIDWSREMCACDPAYYKWNQWLFLKMLEKGIAYRKTQVVNWDPVDQTVLANEQVIDGRGWRSGALVEKREIPGYYLRITDYADELLDQVKNHLPGWPERVRIMQENWIGKSAGVRLAFPHDIKDEDGQPIQEGKLFVFTTRADTLMGVTFCAVAPEHPLATYAARNNPALASFIEQCKLGGTTEAEIATREKEGMRTGLTVTHPLSGQPVEVWVGNYVLMSYGDGAVMGVPAHDERDFAFARKYGLTIRQVIALEGKTYSEQAWQEWYGDKQSGRAINSGAYDGLSSAEAIDAIAGDLAAKGLGEKQTTYRLRDWGISRQRYWGTPIPIIHCPDCGPVPVPEQDLPVVLPDDLIPDGSSNPLAKNEAFLSCSCPSCGKPARRETDTMDTFVDSSWYFMRYTSPGNDQAMVDDRNDYWMPMDQYIGGIEHAVLHLLYARFWTKVMRDLGMLKFDEPFTRLLCQGMVLNHIYSRRTPQGGIEYFWPEEVENIYDAKGAITGARLKSDGSEITYGGVGTMSKSKNNGVDPQSLIDTLGADTARLFVTFASPPEQTLEWSDSGVEGANRFLRRLWSLGYEHREAVARGLAQGTDWQDAPAVVKDLRREMYGLLKQAEYDYQRIQYNTVVSACMKMLNALDNAKLPEGHASDAVRAEGLGLLLRVLYPVVPHVTWQLWRDLGFAQEMGDLLDAAWPHVDEGALVAEEIELMLQVNGKLRGAIRVTAKAAKEDIEQIALAQEEVTRFLEGRPPKRVIVVPGKLVNVVG